MSEAARWQRVKAIFDAAAACRAEDRAALLQEECGNDKALQAEVESLLAADARQEPIFDQSVDRDLRGRVFGAVAGALAAGAHALKQGDRLGGYEITGLIGTGGMGEVYRARDTKLNRSVALKILPNSFASDPDRLARFGREAQLLASLNHPNIAHIYGLEDAHVTASGRSAASPALVLELVEGPTLADRIARAGLPLADAWPIARQVAEALEAAHEQGVVHRDLKPANVKVRPDGIVKVLDFGLARALGTDDPSSSAEAMDSPTMTSPGPLTESRVILGTVPYMSPEQARGKVVDKRADIWAFGCVLFEMLAGRRAFDGETSSDTIAAILERQPDWDALPNTTPANIRLLLQRCLEKDPKRRLRDIGDARIEIEHVERPGSDTGIHGPRAEREDPARRRMGPTILAAGLLAAVALAAVVGVIYFTGSRPSATAPKYTQLTDFADSATAASLSPDGRMVTFIRAGAFFQNPRQVGQVYVKLLPNGEAKRLTDDPRPKFGPVFTPDGSRIAYSVVDAGAWDTWTVPVLGGTPERMLPNASGLSWMTDGRVLFSELKPGTAMHMGIVTATELRAESRVIYFPEHERGMAHYSYASPDRKWVLIVEMGPGGAFTEPCRLVPFDGSSSGRVAGPRGRCRSAAWSPDGKWMFFWAIVDGRSHLWRQAFPTGAAEQITFDPTQEEGVVVAPDGNSLVTSVGEARSALWIHDDRGDRQITSEGSARLPLISRDGRRVFYLQERELMRLDLASGKSINVLPGWSVEVGYDVSADEAEVVFTSRAASGEQAIWLASLDRRSPPRQIVRQGDQVSFGRNGTVIFRQRERNANYLYRVNKDGSGQVRLMTPPIVGKGAVSPDGEWVMVARAQTEADPSQESDAARQETVAAPVGGGEPRRICQFNCLPGSAWSPDGRFLYIVTGPGPVAVLPVPPGQSWPALPTSGIGSAADLFSLPGARPIELPGVMNNYGISNHVYVKTELRRNLYRIQLR